MSNSHEAALAAVHEMMGEGVEASDSEEEQASSTEETAAEETPQEAEQQDDFNLDPEVPDEIRALVEEPDFEAEAEEELQAAVAEEWDEEGEEYADPRFAELRKQLFAAQKKAAYFEQQRVKDARKGWEQEAEKFYPLADPKRIDANSRRAFLRAAKSQHEANKPFVMRGIETTKKELEAEFERKWQEKLAELETAWGKPLSGSAQVPERTAEKKADIDQVFKSKGFHAGVREMLRQGE